MPRIQILELPSTESELNPFALIVDGYNKQAISEIDWEWWRDFGRQIGARGTLVCPGRVQVGADDPVPFGPLHPDGTDMSNDPDSLASHPLLVQIVAHMRQKQRDEAEHAGMPV